MIIFMHSSTDSAVWHSMFVSPFTMLLLLHVSHFSVSVGPTAHHLMAEDCEDGACSGEQRKHERTQPIMGFDYYLRDGKKDETGELMLIVLGRSV